MDILQGSYRGRLLLMLLFFSFSELSAQQEELAELQSNDRSQMIVVDRRAGRSKMLNMQEEMAMYMRLRQEENLTLIHPNPSNGVIWLEHNLPGQVNLEIFDSKGEVVLSAKDMNVRQLDLRAFARGRYRLVVNHESGPHVHQIEVR